MITWFRENLTVANGLTVTAAIFALGAWFQSTKNTRELYEQRLLVVDGRMAAVEIAQKSAEQYNASVYVRQDVLSPQLEAIRTEIQRMRQAIERAF